MPPTTTRTETAERGAIVEYQEPGGGPCVALVIAVTDEGALLKFWAPDTREDTVAGVQHDLNGAEGTWRDLP